MTEGNLHVCRYFPPFSDFFDIKVLQAHQPAIDATEFIARFSAQVRENSHCRCSTILLSLHCLRCLPVYSLLVGRGGCCRLLAHWQSYRFHQLGPEVRRNLERRPPHASGTSRAGQCWGCPGEWVTWGVRKPFWDNFGVVFDRYEAASTHSVHVAADIKHPGECAPISCVQLDLAAWSTLAPLPRVALKLRCTQAVGSAVLAVECIPARYPAPPEVEHLARHLRWAAPVQVLLRKR